MHNENKTTFDDKAWAFGNPPYIKAEEYEKRNSWPNHRDKPDALYKDGNGFSTSRTAIENMLFQIWYGGNRNDFIGG